MSEPNSESDSVLPSETPATPAHEPPASPNDGTTAAANDVRGAGSPSADSPTTANTEGLPEWEPLTPELVEEEAIRGDFMLRWAVVLLALLIGCRQLVDTETLLQVKTGRYLAAHGWWPPARDVFSFTATERPWVNLAWLWDVISAGVFAIGDGIGLSLLTALVVAVTWWLLGQISRSGVSDWFGSILGALALLACHHQFSGRSETLTLLGVVLTLTVWHRWRSASAAPTDAEANSAAAVVPGCNLWWLVPVFVVWSNVDPRMFVGLAILLFWGLGDWIGLALGRAGMSSTQRREFWKVWLTCVIASLLNPFGWQALWSPVVLFGTEYPAWQTYLGGAGRVEDAGPFRLLNPVVWQTIWMPMVAGVVLLGTSFVTLALNHRRANLADATLLFGVTILACLASHELTTASLVACAISLLNAQQWYRESFRQTYSIETRELLFTRGGRAITVAAFFCLAVFSVNQRLFGPHGRRVGLGLSSSLTGLIDGYREATANSFDPRPFNFVPMQGDLLIWLDQKPFVDSRLSLYAGSGLLEEHDRIRHALTSDQPEVTESEWQESFDRLEVTHVMPRLLGARPITYLRLANSPRWRITYVGSACAVLYRTDSTSKSLADYVAEQRVDFVKQSLRTDWPPLEPRADWPRRPTTFQRFVAPRDQQTSPKILEATHWLMQLQAWAIGQLRVEPADQQEPLAQPAALAYLALRKANQGLAESPDQVTGYRILAHTYSILEEIEGAVMQQAGINYRNQMRYHQTLAALYQTLQLDPDDTESRRRLVGLLERSGKLDLALRELNELARRDPLDKSDDPNADELLRQQILRQEQWEARVDELREYVAKAIETGTDELVLAMEIYQAGFVLEALKMLDKNMESVRKTPDLNVARGLMLLESGQIEAAYQQFEYESDSNPAAWRLPASWTQLARGDFESARKLWSNQRRQNLNGRLNGVIASLPLAQSPLALLGSSPWPITHTNLVMDHLTRGSEEDAQLLWYAAMAQLELGQTRVAGMTLTGLLETNPETLLRPLARFYLYLIAEKEIDPEPPSDWIPIDKDIFAPEQAEQSKPNETPSKPNEPPAKSD